MANFGNTARYALRKLLGTSLVNEIDTGFAALADDIDAIMVGISEGPIGSRPTSSGGSPGVLGRLYRATDQGGKLYFDFGTGWIEMGFASSAHEPGDLKATARSSVPAGWLLCDGALVSTATYADLFAAIGHVYNGNVDPGGGQFRVPDYRGRALVGVDGSAGRLTANDALGQSGGAEKVTLVTSEMPSHSHSDGTLAAGVVGLGVATITADNSIVALEVQAPAATGWRVPGRFGGINYGTTNGEHGHDVTGATGAAGSGGSHNNMQPYQTCNVLIKT